MKQFNIKVAGKYATVFVKDPRCYVDNPADYPKIIIRNYWNWMSPEKAMRIMSNSINIKALKRTLIARRIRLELPMRKINAINKNNFVIFDNDIIW